MKHIKTLNNANLKESAVKGGCGECQASCQSAQAILCVLTRILAKYGGKYASRTRVERF